MNYPWLKDTIEVDPFAEPDYPQPNEPVYDRPKYRNPIVERAVKVYTVAQESRYLIIRNLPLTNVTQELIQQLALYGQIEEYDIMYHLPSAPFSQTVWVKFDKVSSARLAKNKMNKTSFFGQDLWIQYAPEYETIDDTRIKLNGRRLAVRQRLEELVIERPDTEIRQYKKKPKLPVGKMTTGGLLGLEEAIPADDFVEVQIPRIPTADTEVKPSRTISELNTQPLRKRKIEVNKLDDIIKSHLSEKEVGALREGEREVFMVLMNMCYDSKDSVMTKVATKLNNIEREAEEASKAPLVRKRRRIYCCLLQ